MSGFTGLNDELSVKHFLTVLYHLTMGETTGPVMRCTSNDPRAAHEDRNGWICHL